MNREDLDRAYRQALYVAHLPAGELVLRIDQPDSLADQRLRDEAGCRDSWALVTAFNPFSQPIPEPENRRSQRRLEAELNASGLRWIAAVHRDPAGRWPDEISCLVIDPPEMLAPELGRRYGQNAIVSCWLGEAPRLQWLAPELS